MKKIWGLLAVAVTLIGLSGGVSAEEITHKLAIQVDQNDEKLMNLALNNAQNATAYYASKGEKVIVEIVTYGPGLHMLRADTSPVKQRIASMSLENPDMQFSACGVTHGKMSKAAGKEVGLLSEATKVPSGVVRLIELQEQSYSYVRP